MNPAAAGPEFGVAAFRVRLLAGMTLLVVVLTLCGLYLAERSVTAETEHDLERAFRAELGLMRTVRGMRHASLVERCRVLVRKLRIHAALEDDALDLLYPSARDELGEVEAPGSGEAGAQTTRARFYRFLNAGGAVIPPLNAREVGILAPEEERRLGFAGVPTEAQTGYFVRADCSVVEVIVTSIVSTETGETIAALVAGFSMTALGRHAAGLRSGLWTEGRVHMPALSPPAREALGREIADWLGQRGGVVEGGRTVRLDGEPHLLFCEHLNPGSLFPPAHEIGIYPLSGMLARQRELRWKSMGAGAVLLAIGLAASFSIASRLAAPVRVLAEVSAENRLLRDRAEEALRIKSDELQRTARFSADASHQLKTPVAVLRAGLDELIARDELSPETREEVAMLVHQTFRLTSIIDDLLLLSRLDTGRLQLELAPVDLTRVVETCIDDLHLLPDELSLTIDSNLAGPMPVLGEKRYTMLIVQNLLDNARKYNRPGGRIRIAATTEPGAAVLTVGNTGTPIPRASWEHIFERFHRAAVGENIPGHGLGLNLARELARLHGGELRLLRSEADWTEFEVRFRAATTPARSLAAA